jgi:hypothetical protein
MNSVAVPVIEYRVITECGRIFSWSATSPDSLFYEFKRDTGLSISSAMPFKDYEAEDKQLELNHEYEKGDAA